MSPVRYRHHGVSLTGRGPVMVEPILFGARVQCARGDLTAALCARNVSALFYPYLTRLIVE